jgi:antagonist of KipI
MSIKIIKKGIADSLQNEGHYGHQHLGIQVGGYMDFLSAQLANKIVGNSLNQTVYEIHFPASHFEFEETIFISIT